MALQNKYHINLLSFNILNKNKEQIFTLNRIEGHLQESLCKFIVFLDQDFLENLRDKDGFFYLAAYSTENKPLIFEQIDFDSTSLSKRHLIEITFKLNIPTHFKDPGSDATSSQMIIRYPKNKVRLRLSFCCTDVTDPYFYQDLEDGTFLDTIIPIKETTNERAEKTI